MRKKNRSLLETIINKRTWARFLLSLRDLPPKRGRGKPLPTNMLWRDSHRGHGGGRKRPPKIATQGERSLCVGPYGAELLSQISGHRM